MPHCRGSSWPRNQTHVCCSSCAGRQRWDWWINNSPFKAENAGDVGLVPGLGRSPGKGNGNPLQCSCLRNPMDRGAWRATVCGVAKSWTRLSYWAQLLSYLEKGYLPACLNRGRTEESLDCYVANNNSGLVFICLLMFQCHTFCEIFSTVSLLTIELLRHFFISMSVSFMCRISTFSDPFIVSLPISLCLFHTFLVFLNFFPGCYFLRKSSTIIFTLVTDFFFN